MADLADGALVDAPSWWGCVVGGQRYLRTLPSTSPPAYIAPSPYMLGIYATLGHPFREGIMLVAGVLLRGGVYIVFSFTVRVLSQSTVYSVSSARELLIVYTVLKDRCVR